MNKKILKELEEILIDPYSKKQLIFDANKNSLTTIDKTISYQENNGIISLLPEFYDNNSKAYDLNAPNYDPWITGFKLSYKILKNVFWGISNEFTYANKVLEFIPEDFNGIILDIPVGTGIFTVEKYKLMKKAKIIVIDYSLEMLKIARLRYKEAGLENIVFFQGDVTSIPFKDESIDLILSMSGIEAFRKKDEAINEISRVLKKKGRFIGCTYIRGKKIIKDIFSKLSAKRTGLVLKPFFNEKEIIEKFNRFFEIKEHITIKSIWCFNSIKK